MIKNSLNPDYAPKDATFDFPLYLSLAEKLGVLELVLWDKDTFKKEYLGEVAIPLEDWFRNDNAFAFDDPLNKVSFVVPARVPIKALGGNIGFATRMPLAVPSLQRRRAAHDAPRPAVCCEGAPRPPAAAAESSHHLGSFLGVNPEDLCASVFSNVLSWERSAYNSQELTSSRSRSP